MVSIYLGVYNIKFKMQIGAQQEDRLSSPLIDIRPIRYSTFKISIFSVITITLFVLLLFISHKLSILLFLFFPFLLIYLKLIHHNFLLYLFYEIMPEDSDQILKYAINDLSLSPQSKNRKSNNVFIVDVHFRQNGLKYFHFKEEIYKIQDNAVSALNEQDIIKALRIRSFQEHLEFGLHGERLENSLAIFKKQGRDLQPNAWKFIFKRMLQEKQMLLVNWFLMLVALTVVQSLFIGVTLALLDLIIISFMINDQFKKVQSFREKFTALSNKDFPVFREGAKKRLPYCQILVGDIIQIEKTGQEDEYMTCFRSILIGDFQIICKEGANRDEYIKSPVRDISDLRQDKKTRFVIKPLSFIQKASLRGTEHLIIMQHASISKFFTLWFKKGEYGEFLPITRENTLKTIKLYLYGLIVLFIVDLLASFTTNHIGKSYNTEIFTEIIFISFIVPAIIHLLFSLNHLKSIKELQKCDIQVYSGSPAAAGCISNIVINFSELLQLQFQEILYKNLIFDPSNRPFEPDSATLQSGRTYQSLLAVIFYLSLGYFDCEQNKSTFLSQLYELYKEYFQYEDRLDQGKNIVHTSSGKTWRLVNKDPENEQGARSWRLEYENHLKYVITEYDIKNGNNFNKYIGREDQNRLNTYIELAEGLIEQGKKIKLLLFKNFKKEGIRNSSHSEMQAQQFSSMTRVQLERDMQFASFIVFDNALKIQNSKTIQFLRDLKNDTGKLFNLFIYSHNKSENLAGFEHILEYIPINYSFKMHEKTALVREKMQNNGTMVFGNDIEDQYGELLSDLSIKKTKNNEENVHGEVAVPSDVYLKGLENIKDLLQIGDFSAKYRLEVVKYIFTVWFWMIFGWLWIGAHGEHKEVSNASIWALILMVLLILVPLALKNEFFFSKSMRNHGKYMQIYTITFVTHLILNTFISILILIVVSQVGLCQIEKSQMESHTLMRRHTSISPHEEMCINLPLLLGGSASVLSFVIFYEQGTPTRKLQWWRFCLPLLWLIMMIVAELPFKLILLCVGIVIFLIGTKLLIKVVGPTNVDQQSQSID